MDVLAAIAVSAVVLGIAYHYWRDLVMARAAGVYPYQRGGAMLSEAEARFLQTLKLAVPKRLLVCPKVRIADCVTVRKGLNRTTERLALTRAAVKNFDFAVVDEVTRQLVVVVELDDEPFVTRKARRREEFIAGACEAACIPIARFRAAQSYDANEVRTVLVSAINAAKVGNGEVPEPQGAVCPECNGALVLFVVQAGVLKGCSVWRCARRPACKGYVLNRTEPPHLHGV
ncbi:DUF2726 domain-containing protein (plasmid) [Flagellatimonas centrodinii]|uniref:DUF2726 domain-containing protein n=1 Tax=Flagellatimonas centrodinii TaxID=2806210 RepID=UPI001FEDF017|nr:DUF2726 domain-containing protein [Flagellatimonas centrodinii]ULQ48316.1 DUF2726 domain-containing protein [Flagellatimonas centrodinii]